MKKTLLLTLFLLGFNQMKAQEFSRKDSLQGGLREERTCYDVLRYDLDIRIPLNLAVNSDLNEVQKEAKNSQNQYQFSGKNRLNLNLFIAIPKEYSVFKNNQVEVISNLRDNRLTDIQRAIVIDIYD